MVSPAFAKKLKLTVDMIRESKRIILACHMNPDGDAIGSMLALGLGLRQKKKTVTMLCPDPIPERYISLYGAKSVKRRYNKVADLGISVDCGSIVQLSRLKHTFEQSRRIVEIDHHQYRSRFGDVQLVDGQACSVGEIVYILLKELKVKIDKRIGEALLISMLVETASFSRPDVTRKTFEFCSELMNCGVDFCSVSNRYYWARRISAVQLSGLCFTRIKKRARQRLVWSIIRREDFEEYGGEQPDVDPVPDEMMVIENVEVAILFREIEDNRLRVSLRSKGKINVGRLATLYGGGGHRTVAGCRIHNSEPTVDKFINQACNLIYRK